MVFDESIGWQLNMHSEASDQGDRGATAPTAEGVVPLPPKQRVEWWVWVAGGMIVARTALLAIPYATHGGEAGMFFWSVGIDPTIWFWLMLFVTLAALVMGVRRRPFCLGGQAIHVDSNRNHPRRP